MYEQCKRPALQAAQCCPSPCSASDTKFYQWYNSIPYYQQYKSITCYQYYTRIPYYQQCKTIQYYQQHEVYHTINSIELKSASPWVRLVGYTRPCLIFVVVGVFFGFARVLFIQRTLCSLLCSFSDCDVPSFACEVFLRTSYVLHTATYLGYLFSVPASRMQLGSIFQHLFSPTFFACDYEIVSFLRVPLVGRAGTIFSYFICA